MNRSTDARRAIAFLTAAGMLAIRAPTTTAQSVALAPKPPSAAVIRQSAINLLQTDDTTAFISERRIALTAKALRSIDRSFPQLTRDWATNYQPQFLLYLADSVSPTVVKRSGAHLVRDKQEPQIADAELKRTGIRAIDSLNRVFGMPGMTLHLLFDDANLESYVRGPLNMEGLRHAYGPDRVPQVEFAWPDLNRGNMRNALFAKGRTLDFVFARGSGDCPSGCIDWTYSYVSYDTLTRVATFEKEWISGTPWAEPVYYWGSPETFSFTPYPTIDKLIAGTRDDRWWYRTNAIHLLGTVLSIPIAPRNGPAGADTIYYFSALKRELPARRQDAFGALVDRLADPDPQVASIALTELRAASRKTFGNDRAGITAWTRWLRDLSRQPAPLEISFLDVGQGDAILIREGAHVALIDAGLPTDSIVDRLHAIGVDSFQVFIASHNHGDHIGSAAAVLSAFPVGLFIDNGVPVTGESESELQRGLIARAIRQEHAPRRTITLGAARLDIIPPPPGVDTLQNNHSMIVRLSQGTFRALLTGDSERLEIEALLAHEPLGHVDLLKAAHHGDPAAAPAAWLQRLSPSVVAISRARGGSPEETDAVLKRYNAPNRIVALTERGDITLIIDADGTYSVYNGGERLR